MTPTNILATSREFQHGFELCIGNGLPAARGQRNALIPGVVCLTFAIELALKSLLLADGNKCRGHDLNELFHKISVPVQAEVIQRVGLSKESFAQELRNAAHAFEDWRYIYEATGFHSINLPFLQSLWNALADPADRAARLDAASRLSDNDGS